MRIASVAAAVAALLICAPPASASWEESRTTWPVTWDYYNTCNDEIVIVNADYTEVVRQRFESGHFRYQMSGWLSNVRAFDSASGRAYDVLKVSTDTLDSRETRDFYRWKQATILRLRPQGASGSKQTLSVNAFHQETWSLTSGEMIDTRDWYKTACV
jgi:hypothetical protein